MIAGIVASQKRSATAPASSVTWNSADKHATITLSEADKRATKSGTDGWASLRGTVSKSTGKWYFEITNLNVEVVIGVATSSAALASFVGVDASGYGYYNATGNKLNNSSPAAYGAAYSNDDVIGVALNLDDGELEFYKNGVSQGIAYTGLSGTFFPAGSVYTAGNSSLRCAARTFPLPPGFSDWA